MIDLIGGSPNFTRIGFAYPKPSHADSYSDYFSCLVIFDSEINFLEFDASILMTKLPFAHPIEYEVARKACEKREFELAHWMPTDLVGQLLCLMYENPISQDVFEFADRLGMSLRSLQRKLKDMGTSFSALQDLVRQDIASKYRTEKHYTAKEMVHRGIPGNAARILRKKYCSSRYP